MSQQQIQQCQTPSLPYIAGHVDASKRMKRGEQQSYCSTCERWKWQDERCGLFVNDPVLEKEIRKACR